MKPKTKLSDEAREARNAAQREWKRKNPDKVRQYNVNYWEKKAAAEGEPLEVKILKLHEQGFSLRDIAVKVGINHVKVSRILQYYK
jgi:hypothetical protein